MVEDFSFALPKDDKEIAENMLKITLQFQARQFNKLSLEERRKFILNKVMFGRAFTLEHEEYEKARENAVKIIEDLIKK